MVFRQAWKQNRKRKRNLPKKCLAAFRNLLSGVVLQQGIYRKRNINIQRSPRNGKMCFCLYSRLS